MFISPLRLATRLCLSILLSLGAAGAAHASVGCDQLTGLKLPAVALDRAVAVAPGPFALPKPAMGPPLPAPALPGFCRVSGSIRPVAGSDIRFELWLPATGWNGRFLQVGNGGLAGAIAYPDLARGLASGFAVASTDDGHRAGDVEGVWAYGHPEALIDYGSRAVHLTAMAAQAIAAAYFGKAPRYRYFAGCSDGGREGLMEAQRFPQDFDGFLVGAPGLDIPGGSLALLHAAQTLGALPVAERLTPALVKMLSARVLAECDGFDGVKDGVLADPRRCSFDPRSAICRTAGEGDCLTRAQAEAVRSIYEGPRDPRTGRPLAAGLRPTLGAEGVVWAGLLVTADGSPAPVGRVAASYLAGVLYGDRAPDPAKLDLAQLARDAGAFYAPVISPTDPDLGEARARGRKIIQYQGWSDPLNPPHLSVDYHAAVTAKLGQDVDGFYRLFMVPGMAHCGGGVGPTTIGHTGSAGGSEPALPADPRHDWFLALIDWVEKGAAPARIIASELDAAGRVKRSRPICPYPARAIPGAGDPADAASFHCGTN